MSPKPEVATGLGRIEASSAQGSEADRGQFSASERGESVSERGGQIEAGRSESALEPLADLHPALLELLLLPDDLFQRPI